MPPTALAPRLRSSLTGGGVYSRVLNWGGPVSLRGLKLYYAGTEGYIVGVRNIVPQVLSGFTDPSTIAASIVYKTPAVPNKFGFEEHGRVLKTDTSGSNWLGTGTPFDSYSPAEFTVFAWVRAAGIASGDQGYIVNHGNAGFSAYNLAFGIDGNNSNKLYVFSKVGGSFPTLYSTTQFVTNRVYFVAASWDTTTAWTYVDGVAETSMSTGGGAGSYGGRWQFGSQEGGHNFDGNMWGIGLFDRVLSPWEINYLYRNPWTLIDGMGNFDNVIRGGLGGEWRT